LFTKHGLLGKGTRAWEFNGYATHQIIDFNFDIRTGKVDHPGVSLMIGLLGYSLELTVYDTRHWDSEWGVYR